MRTVHFVVGDWEDNVIQNDIANHNYDVRLSWLSDGGDPARERWWHVTEVTLDHFRPSPKWIREGENLERARDCEAVADRRQRKEEEKMRLLREVIAGWEQEDAKHGHSLA